MLGSHIKPLKMSEEDQIAFADATHCFIYENPFDEGESNKIIEVPRAVPVIWALGFAVLSR